MKICTYFLLASLFTAPYAYVKGEPGIQKKYRSVSFQVEEAPLDTKDVRALPWTVKLFRDNKYLTKKTANFYFLSLEAHPRRRKYYNVIPGTYSEEKLFKAYANSIGAKLEEVNPVVVTDFELGETYILPSFYSLNDEGFSKSTALALQAYMFLNPNAKNEELKDFASAYIAYAKNQTEPEKLYEFVRVAGSMGDLFFASLKIDKQNGSLKGMYKKKELSLGPFFGNDFINCLTESHGGRGCRHHFVSNVSRLRDSKERKNSFFLRLIDELSLADSIDISAAYHSTMSGCQLTTQMIQDLISSKTVAGGTRKIALTGKL